MTTILAWHFTGAALRDGRPIPQIGTWLTHYGPIEPCKSGLHASVTPWDALGFAPGATLHRVELRGEITQHGNPVDKHVGRERKIIATIDATALLRRFAADMAMSVAHMWSMPDVVRKYLLSLDDTKRTAARAAASDAAWDAASDAARAAAWDAASDAASDAAWDAASDAASAAASAAARAAARAAASDAASAAAWTAASAAAWTAASAAAWTAAGREFNRRVYESFGVQENVPCSATDAAESGS